MVSRKLLKTLMPLIVLLALSSYSFSQSSLPNGFMVIGHNTGIKQMSNKEVVQIFKGKYTNWSNNVQAIIVLPSSKNENAEIISKFIFNASKDAMMKYWLSLVFQGRANPPVFLEKDDDIVEYVMSNSGAIAIVRSINNPQVNKLTIKIVD